MVKKLGFNKNLNYPLTAKGGGGGVAIKFWNYIKFLLKAKILPRKAFFGVQGGITFFYRHWLPPLKLKLRRP